MAFSTKQYAWSNVSVNLLGRTLVGIRGVSYKVTADKEPVFGRGRKALAIQTGNETIEGEIMLLQSELQALNTAVKAINPAYKVTDVAFDLVISYSDGTTATTDILKGVELTEYEKGLEQEDKFMEISIPFLALDLQEGV
jgi:hypothetical protein